MRMLFFIVLMAQGLSVWAQEEFVTPYEMTYQVEYSLDSTHLAKKTTEEVYLYTGKDYGVFMNFNEAHDDEIQADYQKQMRAQKGQQTVTFEDRVKRRTNFDVMFFKSLKTDTVINVSQLVYQNFMFLEPVTPVWEMQDSTKTIGDFEVHKAVTQFAGRHYTAWFTLEIPISDGPYLFKGLPGLIVELYDWKKHYHFSLQNFRKLDEPKVWTIPDSKKVTKAEFQALLAKQIDLEVENIFTPKGDETSVEIMRGDGRKIDKAAYKKMLKKSQALRNNPIELP